MNPHKAAARRVEEDGDDDDEDPEEEEGTSSGDDELGDIKKKKMVVSGVSTRRGSSASAAGSGCGRGVSPPRCQAEKCAADLTIAKRYHRRHKVCEIHAKAPKVIVAGLRQRFCQQCSRFHELSEFDEAKRSCRRRLAGHNERRRKSSTEGSSSRGQRLQLKQNQCRQTDGRGDRGQIILPKTPTFKHFHIH